MPLYGHELSPSINPYEAGLGIFVKLEKPDFIGKAALERARPVSRRRVGLQMTGRGIAREGCPVYDGGHVKYSNKDWFVGAKTNLYCYTSHDLRKTGW